MHRTIRVTVSSVMLLIAAGSRCLGQDWILFPDRYRASISVANGGRDIVMENGLVRRVLRIAPNAATIELRGPGGTPLLRAVRPEARLTLNGADYAVGGDTLNASASAFRYAGHAIGAIEKRLEWKRSRWAADTTWPPHGQSLRVDLSPPAGAPAGLQVSIHYEIYDGIPLLCKWLTFRNGGGAPVKLNGFTSEILAVTPAASVNDAGQPYGHPSLLPESDYAFDGTSGESATHSVAWVKEYAGDPSLPSQMECRPPLGPDLSIAPGQSFESFRTWELFPDSRERERRTLAHRRMYRIVAPWATENPIFAHVTSTDPAQVRRMIDQLADVGFEMLIYSFWNPFNMEDTSAGYIASMQEMAAYARSKGIEIGGYSLLASRSVGPSDDVIDVATGKPGGARFGSSPCLGSNWGIRYMTTIRRFLEKTGMSVLEHDGSYPGDRCASTSHPGHAGYADSQWRQLATITAFYKYCRANGIYLNVPDWYFLSGSTKAPLGYDEGDFSLPRAQQLPLNRQRIYDGTFEKTPSMGWGFAPLVEYHGGGAAATFEPLTQNLADYDAMLGQYFAGGIQVAYRGYELYDSEASRAVVKKWVSWYKAHRDILNSDVIHFLRPDGKGIDAILHVNPRLPERALAAFFNPTGNRIAKEIDVPLYYAGVTGKVRVAREGGTGASFALGADGTLRLPVDMPARSNMWYVIAQDTSGAGLARPAATLAGTVRAEIFDLRGRRVRTAVLGEPPARALSGLGAGAYLVRKGDGSVRVTAAAGHSAE